MSMHTLIVRNRLGIVNLHTDATPPVPTGGKLYIQNISNSEVFMSILNTMEHAFLIGGKATQPQLSIVETRDELELYLTTNRSIATLTIEYQA